MNADATTLLCCLDDITSDTKELVLNNELQSVHSWLKANRLSLHVKKIKYMLFRKQLINTVLLMSFSPLFYVNSLFYMCAVCFLSFVDFNKMFYPKKNRK